MSESIVVLLDGKADIFSPVYDRKIGVCLVKNLVGFACSSGNISRSILTDDGVFITGGSLIRKNIFSFLDFKGEGSRSNRIYSKNVTLVEIRKQIQ